MKKDQTKKGPEKDRAKEAFELYLKEEFPGEGEDGTAFMETLAIDHFMSGYDYGCKDASRQMAEMRAKSLSPKRRSEIARKAAKVSAAVRSAKAKARKENLDK